MSQSLLDLVDQFLDLVRTGSGNQERDESSLVRTLDALASARHVVHFTFDETEYPDPPDWPNKDRRAAVSGRFPDYGYYNTAMPLSENVGEAQLVVGDAVDDIADIAGDLADFAWRWRNTSEADALWHFENSYNSHWGQHLHSLRLYLWARRLW